ncbi:MAG: amidohydrolase family protein [Planctomycetota bacterium]
MLVSGQLLLPRDDDNPAFRFQIRPGTIRIEGDRIVDVILDEISPRSDLGGADHLISPGFVDTHCHLPQFDMIGAHGLPLLRWLQEFTFPAEERWSDAGYAASMTDRVLDQCFAHGTTAICGFATIHHEGTIAALKVAARRGMKGAIGQVLMNRNGPEEWMRKDARQQIDETAQLMDRYPPGSSLSAAITPRFAVSCDRDLLQRAGELARSHRADSMPNAEVPLPIVQTHFCETLAECDLVRELFDGQEYVDVYEQAGLLTERTVLAHGVHLTDQDRETLRRHGGIVAHCPTANLFLRSGTMDRRALEGAGVPVSLGSDIGAGYERSMIRVARTMIEASASLGDEFPSVQDAWWQITAGNARALGWSEIGELKVESVADLVIIRPDIPWRDRIPTGDGPSGPPDEPSAEQDPLSPLLFGWNDRWIRATVANGRVVHQNESLPPP